MEKAGHFATFTSTPIRPRACLAAAGKPPLSAEIAVRMKTPGAKIGDYQPVCCLVVTNAGQKAFER
jgi:hypothetical protein